LSLELCNKCSTSERECFNVVCSCFKSRKFCSSYGWMCWLWKSQTSPR